MNRVIQKLVLLSFLLAFLASCWCGEDEGVVVLTGRTHIGKGKYAQVIINHYNGVLLDITGDGKEKRTEMPQEYFVNVGGRRQPLIDTVGLLNSGANDIKSLLPVLDLLKNRYLKKIVYLYDTPDSSTVLWMKQFVDMFGLEKIVFVRNKINSAITNDKDRLELEMRLKHTGLVHRQLPMFLETIQESKDAFNTKAVALFEEIMNSPSTRTPFTIPDILFTGEIKHGTWRFKNYVVEYETTTRIESYTETRQKWVRQEPVISCNCGPIWNKHCCVDTDVPPRDVYEPYTFTGSVEIKTKYEVTYKEMKRENHRIRVDGVLEYLGEEMMRNKEPVSKKEVSATRKVLS